LYFRGNFEYKPTEATAVFLIAFIVLDAYQKRHIENWFCCFSPPPTSSGAEDLGRFLLYSAARQNQGLKPILLRGTNFSSALTWRQKWSHLRNVAVFP